jgi:hypothetical protein
MVEPAVIKEQYGLLEKALGDKLSSHRLAYNTVKGIAPVLIPYLEKRKNNWQKSRSESYAGTLIIDILLDQLRSSREQLGYNITDCAANLHSLWNVGFGSAKAMITNEIEGGYAWYLRHRDLTLNPTPRRVENAQRMCMRIDTYAALLEWENARRDQLFACLEIVAPAIVTRRREYVPAHSLDSAAL